MSHHIIVKLSSTADTFPATEVDWEDLLTWPYEVAGRTIDGVDCLGIVLEIHRRAGLGLPDPVQSGSAVLDFEELFNEVTAAPYQLFDIFHSSRSDGSHGTGVLVRHGTVITARPGRGVYSVALSTVLRVPNVEFYRIKTDRLP